MDPEYAGGCHCGVLSLRYRTARPPSSWSVRACQCSFCRAHGALTCSDPTGSLQFLANNEALLQRYQFGLRSADFLPCRGCGVYLGATMTAPMGRFGIVNVRVLRPSIDALPEPVAMRYDGESSEERGARRAKNWIPLLPTSA
jgi:hypothetical protein